MNEAITRVNLYTSTCRSELGKAVANARAAFCYDNLLKPIIQFYCNIHILYKKNEMPAVFFID